MVMIRFRNKIFTEPMRWLKCAPKRVQGIFFPLWKMSPSKVATLVEGEGSECMLTFTSDLEHSVIHIY
jgi:hypothetical protein